MIATPAALWHASLTSQGWLPLQVTTRADVTPFKVPVAICAPPASRNTTEKVLESAPADKSAL
jgi:hypothetical protein